MLNPRSLRALLIPCLLFSILAAHPAAAVDPRPTVQGNPTGWQIQTIATRGTTGLQNDLALDAQGYPHVSYLEYVQFLSGPKYQLTYAFWDGIRWRTEIVDDNVPPNSDASSREYTALELGGGGDPHIVYVAGDDLAYAHWDGADWETETVDGGPGYIGSTGSLALDTNGWPHISYHRNSDLWYAAWDGATWHLELVDAGQDSGFSSLALDANNLPHISYMAYSVYDLKYATFDGVEWDIQTIDGGTTVSGLTALALDANQDPHVIYLAASQVKYAYWNGASWPAEVVADPGTTGLDIDLALDSTGNPRIIYSGFDVFEQVNISLTYALRQDETWLFQTLDPGDGRMGSDNALALDAAGNVHASYHEATYGDLRYVTWAPNWLTHTVAALPGLPAADIQVLQAAPHLGFHNAPTGHIDLAAWDGAWQMEPVLPVSDTVTQVSLALNGNWSYVSYYDDDNQRLMFAAWDGQTWKYQVVAEGEGAGRYNQIMQAGSTPGAAHIAFWDGTDLRVKLARVDGLGSVEVYINTAGPVLDADSGRLSMARLPEGRIAIGYHDAVEEQLRVAVWDPATDDWTDELVAGPNSDVGPWHSLQTDAPTGGLAMAYYDADEDTIYFQYQELGTWNNVGPVIEAVGGVSSLALELGLNSVTRPRIAFTRPGGGGLYMASRQNGAWVEVTVATGSPALGGASLALDERPHLAYADGGLFYAFRTATLDTESPAPGAPFTLSDGPYNALDACLAMLNFYLGGDEYGTLALAAPVGQAGPLAETEIFQGIYTLFVRSPAGEVYKDLYVQHGPEMGQLGLEDPDLLWDAYGTLQNFLPGLEALVTSQGHTQVVTQVMVDDALDIWQRLAAAASPKLAAAINAELAASNNLQDFVGLTFAEWGQAIGLDVPSQLIYLPLIGRGAAP